MKIIEDELNIPADYQYKALHHGNLFQRQWHRNRLSLIDILKFYSPGDQVIDLGCGSGNVVLYLKDKVKRIVGADYNDRSLSFLKSQLEADQTKNAETLKLDLLQEMPAEHLELYDKAIMNEVVEHFEENEIDTIMESAKSLIKKDGLLMITTPNYVSIWPLLESLTDRFNLFPKLWGEQHKTKFNRKKLREVCQRHDLEIVKEGSFGHFSPFAAILGHKLADQLLAWEAKHLKLLGPQLFIILKK